MITASAGKARISIVTRSWADAPRQRAVVVENRAEEIPEFVLRDLAGHFPAAHLLVQRVEQLLAGGGAGKGGALEERAAEAALIAKAFGRAIEGHAQAIHQVDDPRRPIGHFLDRRLMLQEVAAVDRVVEVLPLVVALLPREIVDAVDAALGADAVRALDGHQAHQVDVDAQLGQLHGGRQAGQSAANHQYPLLRHAAFIRPWSLLIGFGAISAGITLYQTRPAPALPAIRGRVRFAFRRLGLG